MENLNNIMNDNFADGIPPVFSPAETAKLQRLAEKEKYWQKAQSIVERYTRKQEPWEVMTKKQREWLWKIKDSLSNSPRSPLNQRGEE